MISPADVAEREDVEALALLPLPSLSQQRTSQKTGTPGATAAATGFARKAPKATEAPAAAESESTTLSTRAAALSDEPTTTLSQHLKATRLARGISLDAMARDLRISAANLHHIERGEFDQLPGRTYALGFIRSYADYVELNASAMVKRYKDEENARNRQARNSSANSDMATTTPSQRAQALTRRRPSREVMILSALLLVIVYASWQLMMSPTEPVDDSIPSPLIEAPSVDQTAVDNETTSADTLAADSVSVEAVTDNTAAVGATDASTATAPTDGTTSAAPAQATTAASTATTTPATSPLEAVAAAPINMVLTSNTETWVQLMLSNNVSVFSKVMQPGEQHRFVYQPGMVITTGNAGGLTISVDGATAKPLGRDGQVLQNRAIDPDQLRH